MDTNTDIKFRAYKDDKQKQYDTLNQDGGFYVESSQARGELIRMRKTDEFLNRINLVLVVRDMDNSIGLGSGKLIAARTDTAKGGTRIPRKINPSTGMPYECKQVNFDSAISYETMDAWAHHDDFNDCFEREMQKHANLDLIRVGFFGKETADDSDEALNPNGEDVTEGWIQALRDHREASILSPESEEIRIGEDGHYATVNEAVSAVKAKIAPRHRDVNDLIVLLGSDLVAHDAASFYQKRVDPKQPVHQIEMRQIKESYGAMPAFMPSCFPARGIMVTSFDNLSIYFLARAFRRSFGRRNDRLNRLESFESMSLCYIIEQLDKAAAIDFDAVKLNKSGVWK
ncbi:phage major capsid protein, P2 family [Vibrio sp. DW001]|uniref:P2 family phage major capsid protein n=1 Tax=Vibrio sp. DW001 TaxID=2912315 RepID=UPI0023AFA683|nr:P2 family phage major capsid protein [Vibrio sp. DW001]WED26436.1 phage major capsid protein, P2 family [Vibrio sp. DW001]